MVGRIRRLVLRISEPDHLSPPDFAVIIGEFTGLTKVEVVPAEPCECGVCLRVVVEGEGVDYRRFMEHLAKNGVIAPRVEKVAVES